MKKTSLFLVTGILTVGLLTGCGEKTDPVPPNTNTQSETQTQTETDNTSIGTLDMVTKISDLLGKDDAAVVKAFGEGSINRPEGSTDILGREYAISFLSEDVTAAMSYDDNKKMVSSTIYLLNKELDPYKKDLEAALGKYKSTEEESNKKEGNGRKAYIWETDKAMITLLLAYDTVTLEIAPLAK